MKLLQEKGFGRVDEYKPNSADVRIMAAVKEHLTKLETYQLEYQIKKTSTLNDWKPENCKNSL